MAIRYIENGKAPKPFVAQPNPKPGKDAAKKDPVVAAAAKKVKAITADKISAPPTDKMIADKINVQTLSEISATLANVPITHAMPSMAGRSQPIDMNMLVIDLDPELIARIKSKKNWMRLIQNILKREFTPPATKRKPK